MYIFYISLEIKLLDQIFMLLQIFFFLQTVLHSPVQSKNLRKLPVMYTGSTLVYHGTLGTNGETDTIWTETRCLHLMSKEQKQQKSY